MDYNNNYLENENEIIEEKPKVKVLTIINYVLSAIIALFCIYLLIASVDAINQHLNYVPDPNATVNIDASGLFLAVYIVYGAICIGVDLINIIISIINLKLDPKNGLINLLISLGVIVALVAMFFILLSVFNS